MVPPLEQVLGSQRDGASQARRGAAELDASAVLIDERSPAELVRFARRYASQLLWYGPDNAPAGWWATPEQAAENAVTASGDPPRTGPTFFDGLGDAAAGGSSYEDAAAFLADPAAFPADRHPLLRRPHMALLLTCLRLMRHGQAALNRLPARQFDHHLREVLGLAPRAARPDRVFVLFEAARGVAALEAPAGLRLAAGRDARRRDRVYRLDESVIVTRARVAQVSSTFVDREVIGLDQARDAITGPPEERDLFVVRFALGDPKPGDPLPPFRGAPVTHVRLLELARLIRFSPDALFLEMFELRALLARKRRRDGGDEDWKLINGFLEAAGRKRTGQAGWSLDPANPRDFQANLVKALGGPPNLSGLPEVVTVEDLALHLDRADVQRVITERLFLNFDSQFKPMMEAKRGVDADWTVIDSYLEAAGRRKRNDPAWVLKPARPADFAADLKSALGTVNFAGAGTEAAGVADIDGYLARIEEVERAFYMSAEELPVVTSAFGVDAATREGARAWRLARDVLRRAYARKARADARTEMRRLRGTSTNARDGLAIALRAALGQSHASPEILAEGLSRFAKPDDAALVRDVLLKRDKLPSPEGWTQIDTILDEVRRRRERAPEPEPRREHWRSLWAYADARTAREPGAAEGDSTWRAFGGVPAEAGPRLPPAAIGWAVASPALGLTTGRRRLALTVAFLRPSGTAPLGLAEGQPFTVSLSGAKGWFTPSELAFDEVNYLAIPGVAPAERGESFVALRVAFTLDESQPAIAPSPDTDVYGAPGAPVLRLLLEPKWDAPRGRFDSAYERFRGLKLVRAHLAAATGKFVAEGAPGLWPLIVETDAGPVNGKKPFEPFGPMPELGSELALGHPDLLGKRLQSVSLRLEWMGGPADLAGYYTGYPARDFFKGQLALVEGRVRLTPLGAPDALFAGANTATPKRIERSTGEAARAGVAGGALGPDVRSWRRHLLLSLTGTDFGHRTYPQLATTKSIELANALRTPGSTVRSADYVVNPPYTPKLKRIELDFTAAHEVDLTRYDRKRAVDRVFHVHPFGLVEAPNGAEEGWSLLPAHEEEGALYLGLAGVDPPQSFSLLIQNRQGSQAGVRSDPVRWSYLDAGGWSDFPDPPRDATEGLIRPGVVDFTLPRAEPDGRMPGGLYWVRACVARGAGAAGDIVDLHPHAGTATFVDDAAAPEHYDAPLPPGSIRAPADAVAGLARVTQPYPSFDGRSAEADSEFRVRASERLRHKGRAVTVWDYERLVLERFPTVHKVKCLPAQVGDDPRLGQVRMVIVPDVRAEAVADPFTPRASASLIDEVGDYLSLLTPAAAQVQVVHPFYVRVRVRVGVRFRGGGDEAFNKRRLTERLNRYLAPWAFEEGAEIAIGQRLHATSIVAFIDSLPFVEFVGGLRLFASEDGVNFRLGEKGGESVAAERGDAVLTPATHHEIDLITEDVFAEAEFTGVDYMKIELDWVVG